MKPRVVDHPLAAERLTRLRSSATDRPSFRAALGELAGMLVYEACRELEVSSTTVDSPLGPAPGVRLAATPLLVPVVRAGLGMLEAALSLLPDADVGFIGARRDEETLRAEVYLDTVPAALDGRAVLVLEPMLATGGSATRTCDLLRSSGPGSITLVCMLAAPEGLAALAAAHPDVRVVTAAIDDGLDERGYIVPGLGDAGDRQFGDL